MLVNACKSEYTKNLVGAIRRRNLPIVTTDEILVGMLNMEGIDKNVFYFGYSETKRRGLLQLVYEKELELSNSGILVLHFDCVDIPHISCSFNLASLDIDEDVDMDDLRIYEVTAHDDYSNIKDILTAWTKDKATHPIISAALNIDEIVAEITNL